MKQKQKNGLWGANRLETLQKTIKEFLLHFNYKSLDFFLFANLAMWAENKTEENHLVIKHFKEKFF